jgi:hypothetical protein
MNARPLIIIKSNRLEQKLEESIIKNFIFAHQFMLILWSKMRSDSVSEGLDSGGSVKASAHLFPESGHWSLNFQLIGH